MPKPTPVAKPESLATMVSSTIEEPIEETQMPQPPFNPNFLQFPPPPMFMGQPPISQNFMMQD